MSVLAPMRGLLKCPDYLVSVLGVGEVAFDVNAKGIYRSSAHAGMEAELARWNDRIPADPVALWDWLRAQDTDTLLDVLATFAATTLDAVSSRACEGSIDHARKLADALDLDMAEHWQPSPRFMARLSKGVIAKAVTEAGHPGMAADLSVMKKAAAAVNDNMPVAPWEDNDAETDEVAA